MIGALVLSVNSTNQLGPAVEHRQGLFGRFRRQRRHDPGDAHIPVPLQKIGILRTAEQSDRQCIS